MNLPNLKPVLLAALVSLSFNAHADATTDSLVQRLDQMQKEIENLKKQLAEEKSTRQEQVAAVQTSAQATHSEASATTIGGYGEAVYNNYRDKTIKDEADLRRFVLFFGHRFNDKLRLYSEVEIEHALVEGGQGELAVEQAYIEYNLHPNINLRAGLMILPIGLLNEKHEPPTFYGVERNEVETRIIPSTWRELGLGLQGEVLDGLEYNVGISSSLDASKYTDASKGIRGLRAEGFKAAANDLALYAGLNYRQPGWLLGGGLFTGNTAQNGVGSTSKPALEGKNARLTLWEVHGQYSLGNLDLQALYARGSLGDTSSINQAAGIVAGADNNAAPKSFWGGYGQAAYALWKKGDMKFSPFVRYERYNTQASVDTGFTKDPLNDERVITTGANFNLSRDVVFKADWQNYQKDNRKDRFNLGVGYMF